MNIKISSLWSSPFRAVQVLACGSSVVMGILVLYGWHTGNIHIVKIRPEFVPMAYNTAVSFVLAGLGLFFVAGRKYRILALGCGAAVTLLGGLTVIQYAAHVDLQTDYLLMNANFGGETSYRVKMALNTALCFLVVGAVIIQGALGGRLRQRQLVFGIAGSLIAALGTDAFYGYISNVKIVYGSADSIPMAFHTAASFTFLGIGLIALAAHENRMATSEPPTWLPIVVATTGVTSAVCLWRAVGAVEESAGIRSHVPGTVLVIGTLTALLFAAFINFGIRLRRSVKALKDAEEYRELFVHANDPIVIFDPSATQIINVNEKACQIFGYQKSELVASNFRDLTSNAPLVDDEIAKLLSSGGQREFECVQIRPDGGSRTYLVNISLVEYRGEQAVLSVHHDITERRLTQDALKQNLSLLTSTFEATADGIVAVDLDENILTWNAKFSEMWGLPPTGLEGPSEKVVIRILSQAKDPEELRLRFEHSSRRPDEISTHRLELSDGRVIERHTQPQYLDGKIIGRVLNFRDVTEQCRAEEQLLHDAFHDGLSGLANRALFMDHLRLTIERAKLSGSSMYAVLYLDFDRFKVINDSLGHASGDQLLQIIARRLEHCVRPGDLIARLGGDEFTILLAEIHGPSEALLIAERILSDLTQAFTLGGREVFMSASIGIALGTSGKASADDMVRDADIAMYRAKRAGRAQYQIFDQDMHLQATRQLQIETDLRHGLDRGEFCLYYQPIVRISDGRLVGFEALMRWQHPTNGLIPPDVFIPIAEESGMIVQLGRWAIEEACRQLRAWQLAHPRTRDLTTSVNLSCQEFLQKDLVDRVRDALQATRLDPRCLKLEITETHLMQDSVAAAKIIEELNSIGVELSIDDFGTGYSSLGYLHDLPVSYLKIDRSFIGRMVGDTRNGEIVHTIIKLAQSLKMKVVAEGIEVVDQLERLQAMNCELGQGYLFSKPLSPADAEQYIVNHFEAVLYRRPTVIERTGPLSSHR